jgi:vancomycin resistance protein YoaR
MAATVGLAGPGDDSGAGPQPARRDPHGGARVALPGGARRVVAIGASVAVIGLSAAVLADTALTSGRTARGLTLSGRDIGAMSAQDLRRTIDGIASEVTDKRVTLRASTGDVSLPAGTLGLSLDRDAVVGEAEQIDRDGPFFLRPLLTVRAWFTDRDVPLRFTVDADQAVAGAGEVAAATDRPAVEPGVQLQDDSFVAVPGTEGERVDLDALPDRLLAMANQDPDGPWSLTLPTTAVAPRHDTAEAEALAKRANQLARSPLTVITGGTRTTMPPGKVRSWLRAVPAEDLEGEDTPPSGLVLQADTEAVIRDVTEAVGDVGERPTDASFRVSGDRVEIIPGRSGTACCAPDSGARVAEAVLAGESTVTLDLVEKPAERSTTQAERLGIRERVATFTTNHPAGQPRVTNIQLAADALRGAIVEPGATFSLNQRLGQRTTAKGYVEAGVIYDNVMTTDVGGGVSQLTTTLFNAVFFAGLEFRTYQSHSLYIDRYPYGREATISWPSPDLSFRNTSPHGLLIWTSYDATSITVSIYSTKWVTVEQTGQREEPFGPCTRVHTERTRTFVKTGRKAVDHVNAVYQPGEGVSCYGRNAERPPGVGEADPGARPAPTDRSAPSSSTTAPTTAPTTTPPSTAATPGGVGPQAPAAEPELIE